MQTEIDMEILMGAIQRAAMRRGMLVGYAMGDEDWTVTDFAAGGKVVGRNTSLERIFDVLDEHPVTMEGKLAVMAMENEENGST